jgi:hypothetical protein
MCTRASSALRGGHRMNAQGDSDRRKVDDPHILLNPSDKIVAFS